MPTSHKVSVICEITCQADLNNSKSFALPSFLESYSKIDEIQIDNFIIYTTSELSDKIECVFNNLKQFTFNITVKSDVIPSDGLHNFQQSVLNTYKQDGKQKIVFFDSNRIYLIEYFRKILENIESSFLLVEQNKCVLFEAVEEKIFNSQDNSYLEELKKDKNKALETYLQYAHPSVLSSSVNFGCQSNNSKADVFVVKENDQILIHTLIPNIIAVNFSKTPLLLESTHEKSDFQVEIEGVSLELKSIYEDFLQIYNSTFCCLNQIQIIEGMIYNYFTKVEEYPFINSTLATEINTFSTMPKAHPFAPFYETLKNQKLMQDDEYLIPSEKRRTIIDKLKLYLKKLEMLSAKFFITLRYKGKRYALKTTIIYLIVLIKNISGKSKSELGESTTKNNLEKSEQSGSTKKMHVLDKDFVYDFYKWSLQHENFQGFASQSIRYINNFTAQKENNSDIRNFQILSKYTQFRANKLNGLPSSELIKIEQHIFN